MEDDYIMYSTDSDEHYDNLNPSEYNQDDWDDPYYYYDDYEV
jgi:hypothetical protein